MKNIIWKYLNTWNECISFPIQFSVDLRLHALSMLLSNYIFLLIRSALTWLAKTHAFSVYISYFYKISIIWNVYNNAKKIFKATDFVLKLKQTENKWSKQCLFLFRALNASEEARFYVYVILKLSDHFQNNIVYTCDF